MQAINIEPISNEDSWSAAKSIRKKVFIEEQSCPPEEEWDEHDAVARHIILRVDGCPAGTARWRATHKVKMPVAKLERFAILREYRGCGLGRKLVQYVIDDAEQAGFDAQYIHAQAYLKDFYASFGFKKRGEPFDEVGIPHIAMLRTS